ncbi:putative nucleotidyltransferase [Caudoviricetes sp.]|nr:putative nucleotidyltransferase [Caudoviricetes sp.]
MNIITKVVVGSRLHGLANEKSDWDYRGIHMYSLKDTLSPFKKLKNTDWVEGDQDNTSYELAEFCKNATQGNATILEVFFSDQIIETSPIADEMRANWQKFMDTDRFVMASRGYAANQLNKMALFDDIGVKGQVRTNKFMIAYVRVLWQCAEFLKTGEFKCKIEDPNITPFLLELKNNFDKTKHIPKATEMFAVMQAEVSKAWATAPKLTPDVEWIEDFIYRSYKEAEK